MHAAGASAKASLGMKLLNCPSIYSSILYTVPPLRLSVKYRYRILFLWKKR